jgi:hypothetical protein
MNIDDLINKFRIASRELFNNYFRIEYPWEKENQEEAWYRQQRYAEVEKMLWQQLVLDMAEIDGPGYEATEAHPKIRLRIKSELGPIMLNREFHSGYWDYPVKEVTDKAVFGLIGFFDFDNLSIRDNQYARAKVLDWPAHPETIGKHALLDANNVVYFLDESNS